MNNFIDFNQIRVNAVLGVCARQRELVAENKKLQKKINTEKLDFTVGCIGFSCAVLFMIAVVLF